jgi:N-acyl-D-amino-acid deacylase
MLGRFVRLERLVPLEAAIAKMTSGPAAQIGVSDRGVIETGRRADVVVFDAARISSLVRTRSLAAPSAGVEHVLVNGSAVVRSGRATDALPGTVGL